MADNYWMIEPVVQRSGLPLFLLAAFVLAAAAGLVLLLFSPLSDGLFAGRTRVESTAADQVPNPPAVEPAETTTEDSRTTAAGATVVDGDRESGAPTRAARRHTVLRGDTLFDLAGRYWSDSYLWPVLFVENQKTLVDPDLLFPGSGLDVPDSPSDTRVIVDAHLRAYERYRNLGDEALRVGSAAGNRWLIQLGRIRINKAHWVLYSGLRYDENLVRDAENTVPERDLEVVRGFITRFGPRPGSR